MAESCLLPKQDWKYQFCGTLNVCHPSKQYDYCYEHHLCSTYFNIRPVKGLLSEGTRILKLHNWTSFQRENVPLSSVKSCLL